MEHEYIPPKKIDMQPSIDNALYIIDKIRPEIERGNFRAIYRWMKHLEQTCKLAAIIEERNNVGFPLITIKPFDGEAER